MLGFSVVYLFFIPVCFFCVSFVFLHFWIFLFFIYMFFCLHFSCVCFVRIFCLFVFSSKSKVLVSRINLVLVIIKKYIYI